MRISKRCQYALKAVFELAVRNSTLPVKIHDLATAQNIPPRFLEVILNQLRHAGFVESERGKSGGYFLARSVEDLSVGEIIDYIQGTASVTADESRKPKESAYFYGDYAFTQLWQNVKTAVSGVWDNTTFADLIKYENTKRMSNVPNYSI